ncbi:MAG: Zn-dependent alcohol dehydrogenase [Myxococcales bacterium]|nr:Zn-dependent alcohol dehydrogenase [Myxococcales bacterium]
MKAAVMRAAKQPLEVEDIQISKPGPHEVLLRTEACGVCHSDLHMIDGAIPVPLPTVLGHEPAGIVEQVGDQVGYVKPGDRVVACLSVFCGACEFCLSGRPNLCGGASTARAPEAPPRLSKDGETIHQFTHLSAFAEQMLVHENAVVKIQDEIPLDRACLIGCGVTTGVGAALNTARVEAGSSVCVIGCGGVGLSVIQGASIAGAGRIIAVDRVSWKLDLAASLGATDGVDASESDPVMAVRELTGGGVDYAFEAIGLKETGEQAFHMIKAGGMAVIIGVYGLGVNIELPGLAFLQGKRVVGSMMGSNRFRIDIPRYADFYLDGRLKLDEMISARRKLGEINDAFDAMRKVEVARSVITF